MVEGPDSGFRLEPSPARKGGSDEGRPARGRHHGGKLAARRHARMRKAGRPASRALGGWDDAVDLEMNRAEFDQAFADIGENLVRRFGGRIMERYVEEDRK